MRLLHGYRLSKMIVFICFLWYFSSTTISALSLERSVLDEIEMEKLLSSSTLVHQKQKRHVESSPVTNEIKETLLGALNEARSNVFPTAAKMKAMMWDDALATSAQEWADQCSYNASSDNESERSEFRSFIILNGSLDSFDYKSLLMIDDIQSSYTYSDTNCSSDSVCGECTYAEGCLQYTQIIWADTEYVGCGLNYNCGGDPFGLSDVNDTVYLVCHYSPPGNIFGLPPYQQDESCSNCSHDYPGCVDNLCAQMTSNMSKPAIPNAPGSSTEINEGNQPENHTVFSCNPEYMMDDESSDNVTCEDDSQWPDLPNCTAQKGRDSRCTGMGGKCQKDSLSCAGSYHSGLCSGPASRRCCVGSQGHGSYYCSGVKIYPRKSWGARKPKKVVSIKNRNPVGLFFVHHTQCNCSCLNFHSCAESMRRIQKWHMRSSGKGYIDIGYSFLVGEDGNAYEGRGWNVEGAHTLCYNRDSYAASVIGNYMTRLPNRKALKAVKALIKCGISKGYIRKNYRLYGHRDAGIAGKTITGCNPNKTDCPGDAFYKHIQTWPRYSRLKPFQ